MQIMTVSNIIVTVIKMIDYAVILRNKRIALGYNQQKLAELAGISQPFLNQIETKAKKPSIDVFFRL